MYHIFGGNGSQMVRVAYPLGKSGGREGLCIASVRDKAGDLGVCHWRNKAAE